MSQQSRVCQTSEQNPDPSPRDPGLDHSIGGHIGVGKDFLKNILKNLNIFTLKY